MHRRAQTHTRLTVTAQKCCSKMHHALKLKRGGREKRKFRNSSRNETRREQLRCRARIMHSTAEDFIILSSTICRDNACPTLEGGHAGPTSVNVGQTLAPFGRPDPLCGQGQSSCPCHHHCDWCLRNRRMHSRVLCCPGWGGCSVRSAKRCCL